MYKRFASVLFVLIVLYGCAAPAIPAEPTPEPVSETVATDAVSNATAERYREGELRELNGIKLDPAVGPRDNSIGGTQYVDIERYRLTVDGLANKPGEYTYDEAKALAGEERLVTIYCVEGWNATILWKGVPIMTLLAAAEPKAEANTVIFHAADGYTTSLPLQKIADNNLILAYGANGIALPPEMGYPFIVVAEDKWGYKWARWVSRIELSSDASYQGYWESNGYSNDADLGKPSWGN